MDLPRKSEGVGMGQDGPIGQNTSPHHALAGRPRWRWHLSNNAIPEVDKSDGDGRQPFTEGNATTADTTQKWSPLGLFMNLMKFLIYLLKWLSKWN